MTSFEPTIESIGISDVEFGEGVRVVEPVNLYGCTIGDHSFIGPFVEIQKGVRIGRNCRIQSHVFICELVEVCDNCFVSHGVMFVNDLFQGGGPAAGDKSLWKATHVGQNVSIGTHATILPVTIADGVVIGAGAVVTQDLRIAGVYAGNPARLLRTL